MPTIPCTLSCSLNVKIPTIVGILTFISMINCMFSLVEYENVKSFITSGPVIKTIEPRYEKTGLRDLRPGPTQTGLYSY